MDDDIIIISDLVKKFGEKTAINGLDLRVHRGELFGFLGPNGAGKTTTVRCISTLTNFDSGSVFVDGIDLKKNQTAAKNRMGVIQQQISLDKDLTIRENMISHAMYHLIPKKERDAKIKELSDYFGLEEYLDKPVDSLSGGWKKRAAIVCAMLHEPAVLFLDEPTSGLDINARRLLWDVVKSLHAKGTTVFLTTHYIEEAEALCDRVGIINHGKIIALDEPKKLCENVGKVAVEYMVDGKTSYKYFKTESEAKEFVSGLSDMMNVLIRATNLEDVFVELTGTSVGSQK
ncbi:MAG: ABC transporter ATP-binding protein [Candidatus Methanomethylophilaceae archaeon]|nr:ABC transporter ATP-binding protein [Candidatus Methanomethylophilaceae archaeon]